MVRISFLVLLLAGLCFTVDRSVVAHSRSSMPQDTTKKGNTLRLDTVQLKGVNSTAKDKFDQKKSDYKSIYFWGDTKDMVTLPHQGGLAVNLNKLYNKFSRKGRHSRRLQRQFEREYEADLVREEWFALTKEYTVLSGDSLTKFRMYYQPTLKWLRGKDNYEKIAYIQHCLKCYLDSVELIHSRLSLPGGDVKP